MIYMTQMKLLYHQLLKRRANKIEQILGIVCISIGIPLLYNSYMYELTVNLSHYEKYISSPFNYFHGVWLSFLIFGVFIFLDGYEIIPKVDTKQWFIKQLKYKINIV